MLLGEVARPGAGGEAEGSVIGERDGVFQRTDAEEQSEGAEGLLFGDGGSARDVRDDSRGEVVAGAGQAMAAGEQTTAGGNRGVYLSQQ